MSSTRPLTCCAVRILAVLVVPWGCILGCGSDTSESRADSGSLGGAGLLAGTGGMPEGAGGMLEGAGGVSAGAGGTSAGVGGEQPKDSLTPDNSMDCEPPAQVGLRRIEAECAFGPTTGNCDGTPGGQQGAEVENDGTTVGYLEGGDVLWYGGVEMDGLTTLALRYAKGVEGGGLEVRLDGTSGTLLGTLSPSTTGDWATWSEATLSLTAATGVHDLYLVATDSSEGILNLDWLELSAGPSTATERASAFHLNHLGYDTLGPKHAVAEGPAGLTRFSVVDATGRALWCGDLVPQTFTAWGSTDSFYSIDFTELTVPGTYTLQIGSTASQSFSISAARHFAETAASVVSYFRSSRADDAAVVAVDQNAPLYGSASTRDVHGGWYDASGDISKYLSHLSYANYFNPQQIPLVVWALTEVATHGGNALTASGQAAAIRAEALYGADYLLRVLDPQGFFYMTVFDQWTGEVENRQICAFEGQTGVFTADYQTALREGGGMSVAALARAAALGENGEYTSSEYLAGAERAFAYLNTGGVTHADDGRENIIDDYTGLLAATELYAVTGATNYLDAARTRAASLLGRLGQEGYFIADGATRPFWHASDAGLPVVALARYATLESDPVRRVSVEQGIRRHLSYLVAVTRAVTNPFGYARQHTSATQSSFFIPHVNETGYWWQGENARLASLATAALMGAEVLRATGTEYLDWLRFAGHQLDWILGKNPYDICFLHGFGRNNPPAYSGEKPENGTWPGGIVNGITGSADDGSGILWMGAPADEPWDNWRWNEQWLPHSTWFLLAVTALSRQ